MDVLGLVYQNPKSLYCCCIEYVASNLPLIESLIGFPEMIGREIFQAAADFKEGEGSFCFKTSSGRRSLQVFFDAYGASDILPSLSLSKDYIFFNDVIDDSWWIFEHLVQLDLSSCGIGDGHDFMVVLDRMLRLQTLSLRDNQVTDEGVRRLTVKSRMSRTSSLVLKNLDMSNNSGITVKSVNFLRCLPSLALLNVSGTSIKFKDTVLLNNWEAYTEHQDICDCITSNFLVKTVGWAADVLENWKVECQLSKRTSIKSYKSAEPSSTLGITGQTFYSRSTLRTAAKSSSSPLPSVSSQASSAQESKNKTPTLILMSHTFFCPHNQPQRHLFHQSDTDHKTCAASNIRKAPVNTGRPQTIGADRYNKHEDKYKPTRTEMLADGDFDESMLDHYRCSPPKKKLKRLSVLQLLDDCS